MYNKVIIIGHLGADPELRRTESGTSVANLSVATSESWVVNGEKKERTTWHRVVVWEKMADHCDEYLSKGKRVLVEGKLQTRKYTDKDNIERYAMEIVANTVKFLTPKSETGGSSKAPPPPSDEDKTPVYDQNFTADDIPF